jgi:hypothetical protein
MEALAIRRAMLFAALVGLTTNQVLGANVGRPTSVRSEHFIVSAPSEELAREVCLEAERFRKELAIEWLGRELPPWRGPCPITVRLQTGAGGATSFMFTPAGEPFGWTMNIYGPRERILDSVLPHEITHTIFATHFGGPLPRWADEGACTTVEHASEKAKQDGFLIQFLHTDKGIPFNQMFRMTEYPNPILPLYAQGYSLTRYLLQQGGKRKFVNYVGDGMATNNWGEATRKHYGFKNLSDLQVTWVEWVRSGSPNLEQKDAAGLAALQQPAVAEDQDQPTMAESLAVARQNSAYGWQATPAQNARTFAESNAFVRPAAPTNFAAETVAPQQPMGASNVSRPVSDGWYAKKRDQAQGLRTNLEDEPAEAKVQPAGFSRLAAPLMSPPTKTPPLKATPASGNRRVLMEWRKDAAPPSPAGRTDVTGLALGNDVLQR